MNLSNSSSRAASFPAPLDERASATAELLVAREHLASAYGGDAGEAYPSVLSTPALLGLLERACAAVMQPCLSAGEMSVGVNTSLAHKAPTALGQSVKGSATFLRKDRRLFLFSVSATDAGGVVATGEHSRAIVKAASIEQAARARAASGESRP